MSTSPIRHIYFDATSTLQTNFTSGIQRVVRELAKHMAVAAAEKGIRFDLVYFDGTHYRTTEVENLNLDVVADEQRQKFSWAMKYSPQLLKRIWRRLTLPILMGRRWFPRTGDVMILADSAWQYNPWVDLIAAADKGVAIHTIVYDLLPIKHPRFFRPAFPPVFEVWWKKTNAISASYICISASVKKDVDSRMAKPEFRKIPSSVFPLGFDFKKIIAPMDASAVLDINWDKAPVFLMVGTMEPRKNYAYALAAFERVWQQNPFIKLIIVGREGWLADDLKRKIMTHPQFCKSLFWLPNCSDAELYSLYARVDVVMAASIDEGYGLPIVEGEARGVSVLASDIPVFREVASPATRFFALDRPQDAVDAILATPKRTGPAIAKRPLQTWADSASKVLEYISGFTK